MGFAPLPSLLEDQDPLGKNPWGFQDLHWEKTTFKTPLPLDLGWTLPLYLSFDCVCDLWILCCYSSGCVIGDCWSDCFFVFLLFLLFPSFFPPPSVKRSLLGFYPTSSWYHEPRWFTSWSPYLPLSSLILLFFVLIRKSPPKIAAKNFLAICWSCEIGLFWSMNLVFGKWIYPSPIIPTLPPLEFGQKLGNHHEIKSVRPLTKNSMHTGHRDPVHTEPRAHGPHLPRVHGLSRKFRPFFCFLILFHHHLSCSSAPFHVFVWVFGCDFSCVLRCFGYLGASWSSSPPIFDSDNTSVSTRSSSTVSKDGNLDDTLYPLPLPW